MKIEVKVVLDNATTVKQKGIIYEIRSEVKTKPLAEQGFILLGIKMAIPGGYGIRFRPTFGIWDFLKPAKPRELEWVWDGGWVSPAIFVDEKRRKDKLTVSLEFEFFLLDSASKKVKWKHFWASGMKFTEYVHPIVKARD